MTEDSRPVVGVWRTNWLPPSETFIANQSASYQRWRALRFGLRSLPGGLPVVPDRAPFGRTLPSRVLHRISAAAGYRGAFNGWLKRAGVRLVHAHFGPGGIAVLPIVERAGLPLVVTFHGYDVTSLVRSDHPNAAEYRRSLERLFRRADRLIAVSEFIAQRLLELGAPAEKIVVHYIGIPTSVSPVTQQAPADCPRIVFVGRLVEVKGVSHLIEAVARLPMSVRRQTSVRIVGDGPELESLRALAASHDVAADFTGRLTPQLVAAELQSATVFCGPSHSLGVQTEAFGLTFLEAALAGLPVVAYRSGGVPEAVLDESTGLLAPDGDIDALAANLERVLTDPELALRLGDAGRHRVRAEFDIAVRTAALEELYDEVLASRSSSTST